MAAVDQAGTSESAKTAQRIFARAAADSRPGACRQSALALTTVAQPCACSQCCSSPRMCACIDERYFALQVVAVQLIVQVR